MKRPLVIAAILGFVIPIVYGFIEILFYNAPYSDTVEFFAGWLPRILCPVWILANGPGFVIAIPFLNAATYALIAYVWLKAKKRLID